MSKQAAAAGSKTGFLGRIGGWISRHKVLCIILAVLIAAAVAGGVWLSSRSRDPFGAGGRDASAQGGASYEFIRTVTLSKTSLDETVSTTGTVQSANTSTVSYSGGTGMGAAALTVKTVHVAVGDTVKAGDVIVTLDDSDILASIEDAEEELAERIEQAKEKLESAQEAYNEAVETSEAAEPAVFDAQDAITATKKDYDRVIASVASFQAAYDSAVKAQESAGLAYNEKKATHEAQRPAYEQAVTEEAAAKAAYDTARVANEQDTENSDPALDQAEVDAKTVWETATQERAAAQTAVQPLLDAEAAYTAAQAATQSAQQALNEAKKACNYDTYVNAYNQAQNTYTSARSKLDQLEAQVTTAAEQLEAAEESYSESGTSTTLEDLYDQLDTVQLKAETDGKITALNVGVGDTPSGVVATVQDTDALKISVTIQEADINDVKVGMNCRIQSDATEGVIPGTLTQLDPVSSQGGSFGAEVTVNDKNTGLLIGMNASVEIVLSSTEDCFSVPQDAVGNDDDGLGDYVYRSTGGSGVDMTFEKVYVTTGQTNDYYIEIAADELAEGDVIRASADLTQGIEAVGGDEEGEAGFDMAMPGGMGGFGGGGEMPGGDFGGDFGGGMPDFGGGSGGGMPGGGGFPG